MNYAMLQFLYLTIRIYTCHTRFSNRILDEEEKEEEEVKKKKLRRKEEEREEVKKKKRKKKKRKKKKKKEEEKEEENFILDQTRNDCEITGITEPEFLPEDQALHFFTIVSGIGLKLCIYSHLDFSSIPV